MSNALVTLNENQFALMMRQAEIIAKSGLVPKAIATPEKVAVVLMTGHELGLPPMTALRSIDVIDGTPALKPQAMMALIERSDLMENIEITDDGNACTVTMTRKGRAPHTETYSKQDAFQAKLSNKYNWQNMPTTMRKWRAIAACARVVFPDVILGLYTTEEIGDQREITEDGEVIDHSKPVIVQTPEQQAEIRRQRGIVTPVEVEDADVEQMVTEVFAKQRAPETDVEEVVIEETAPAPENPFKHDMWWKDDARWNKLVNKAVAELWRDLDISHARNRVAKALGWTWDDRHSYAGCSVADAWKTVQAYVPSDQRAEQPELAQTVTDSEEINGYGPADTGEEWTPEKNPLLEPVTPEPAPVAPAQPVLTDVPKDDAEAFSGECVGCHKETTRKSALGEWRCQPCAEELAATKVTKGARNLKPKDPLKPAAGE